MAGIFTAISAVDSIFNAIKTTKEDPTKAIDEYKKLRKNLPAIASDGSITKFLSNFIVEPVIIITKDARETEVADKLALLNTDIFASFYLQAFHALVDMHGFSANVAVNVLGTDNSSMFGVLLDKGLEQGIRFGVSKLDRQDYFGNLINPNSKYLSFSCEATGTYTAEDILRAQLGDLDSFWTVYGWCNPEQRKYVDGLINNTIKVGEAHLKTKLDKASVIIAADNAARAGNSKGLTEDSFKDFTAKLNSHYSYTGKCALSDPKGIDENIAKVQTHSLDYVSKKITDAQAESLYYMNHRDLRLTLDTEYMNGKKRTIIVPITIKTHIIVTHIDQILNMLKPNDRTKRFGYRLDEWKAGAISLKELIFCGDLINSYKKNKLKDKEGLLDIVKKREESANSKLVTSDMVGFEKYYNMLIVTADEKVLLNKHIGGDILNERYKQELLTEAHALTLSVVDQDYERVYILTKDIRGRSDVTFKAIAKKSNKESDSTDILKALIANRPPVF